tara:strand:+ start:334 stop:570 length:237 start_codon:yes stop_codon:yes gene_type:complete
MLLGANYCECMIQIYISAVDNDVDLSIFGQVRCEEIFNDLLAMLRKVPVGLGGDSIASNNFGMFSSHWGKTLIERFLR